jgi:SAM-dependent methyltransferase
VSLAAEPDLTGAELRYAIDRSRLEPAVARCVRELAPDEATFAFLRRQADAHHSRARWLAHGVVRACCSHFTTNALLGTYRLHLLSGAQWEALLGPRHPGRLLDVGAGVGDVTRELARSFGAVRAVETSGALVRRLREHGIDAVRADLTRHDVPDTPYDAVALLNVLDRCARPLTLLHRVVDALVPDGRLLLSMPLPYTPLWFSGPRPAAPKERLPLGTGSWEAQAGRLVAEVLAPAGLELEVLSRAPYLSEGDRHVEFYELDAVVVVARRSA